MALKKIPKRVLSLNMITAAGPYVGTYWAIENNTIGLSKDFPVNINAGDAFEKNIFKLKKTIE